MTAPIFQSAKTNADGNKVILTYNEALSTTTADNSSFNVRAGGVTNNITSTAISGLTVELTLNDTPQPRIELRARGYALVPNM